MNDQGRRGGGRSGQGPQRRDGAKAPVTIVLGMLMAYSMALMWQGFPPTIAIGIAAALCGLAAELVRRAGD